ncbi:MAG: rhomboid family intramembrane serine protease [Bacteroidaceae bacterium]|nr:rhomboid family intramembrane serine protease [Bacteroidaceae bacterium]
MRSIPPIVKNLLIINVLVFIASELVLPRQGIMLDDTCGLHFFLAKEFYPHQFITYMFLHGSVTHLLLNMFALWMFGGIVERTLGTKRFIIYYLVCGIGAGICQEIAQYIHYSNLDIFNVPQGTEMIQCINLEGYDMPVSLSSYLAHWNCVGASGCIYGILLAFGICFPEERLFIFPIPVPIKAKYFVLIYAVIEVMSVVTRAHDGVAHIAHLGGMVFGLLLILYWKNMEKRRRGNGGTTYVTFDSYNKRI